MNTLDRYVRVYECLHNRKGISPFLLSPIRRIVRFLANRFIPKYFEEEQLILSDRQSEIIVSLTSSPARISSVHLVIQCMLRQTILPRKIILWLSKEQFESITLPDSLTSLESDIFNIRFVDGDIKSHKKYFYVLSEFPNMDVLLVDDDLYYPTDMIEKMQKASEERPNTIICRFCSIMKYNSETILPYNDWWSEVVSESDDQNLFFGSGGGTLLKKSLLYKDVLDINLATSLTPLADDIWLNAMVNLKGTKKFKIYCGLILQIEINNNQKLSKINVSEDKNTEQMNMLINYYKTTNGLMPFPNKK